MLAELTIVNFAIIERLHLQFTPGFSVLTGETGAGKSIIIDAVGMLLGGRADTSFIRTETDLCTIEGIFYLSDPERARIDPVLARDDLQADNPNMLILAREMRRSGHNVCRVNGRAVRLSVLEAIGAHLIDIHGQSEHLSLLNERTHLDFLDRYAGLEVERMTVAERTRELRAVQKELDNLLRNERELSRRADLLRYQVEEIGEAELEPGEDEVLIQERNRLANAEKLSALCGEMLALLSEGSQEGDAAIDLLGQASRSMANLARIDSEMEPHRQRIQEIEYDLNDLAMTLRDYQAEIEYNPRRLNQIEGRLGLIRRLQHKYGDSIAEILAFGQRAAEDLERIEHSGERIEELRAREEVLLAEVGRMGAELSLRRRSAGKRLASAVEAQLAELRMEGARFEVEVQWQPSTEGAIVCQVPEGLPEEPGRYAFDDKGLDRVTFLLAANIGEDLKPMTKVASGGETSRLMLALKTALAQADEVPTLIFDEIDQGIGGRVGGIVGLKLWGLSKPETGPGRQVFCVTHLPQLAGYADAHLMVHKAVSGGRTRTVVDTLKGEERVVELAQMLGGDTKSARETAKQLMARSRPSLS
jgi:DNA repair protein RecN (Recombination protein N)